MQCLNCGAELNPGDVYCTSCGYQNVQPEGGNTYSEAGNAYSEATTVLEQSMYEQPQPHYGPALKFTTGRSLVKMIFLSLITLGIYGIVQMSRIPDEINMAASRYDGKKTMPFFAMIVSSAYTFGILPLVWYHNISKRIGDEARRRGYSTTFGAADFWLWNVLGSLILIGPLVYMHKLCKNMNMVNESYNIYG